ncbi:MAG: YihY/virulence factor BrkB family protein [Dermatophilaceae bacterium]
MGAVRAIDAFQRRCPVLGLPIALVIKYIDDQGAYLAALITYYGFISLFPLLLLLSSILGFLLQSDPGLQGNILNSALAQLPLIGGSINRAELQGSTAAVVIGAVGAIYGALGVAQAMQNAMNASWYVPRNSRPNPVFGRAKSFALLLAVGVFLISSTLLSQLTPTLEAMGADARTVGMWPMVASAVLTWLLFLLISRFGTSYPVTRLQALPGSLLGVVLWQLLQSGGANFARSVVVRSSPTYGVFAVVLGLLGWIYLASVAFVLCNELNAVLALRLYPRALLTPLTDHVDLTEADRAAYAGLARAQRLKGFQAVEVTFAHEGQYATARRDQEAAQQEAQEAQEVTAKRVEQAHREGAIRKETGGAPADDRTPDDRVG